MKKLIALFLVLYLLALSGNLMSQEEIKGVSSFGGGLFFAEGNSTPFVFFSLGVSFFKGIEVELSGFIIEGNDVIAGNLVLEPFDIKSFIPYVTGGVWTTGVWTTTEGGFGFNIGGGLKIRISEVFAIRAEYRRWFVEEYEWGVNSIMGGISYFF